MKSLPPRLRQVLALMAEGKTTKETASLLGIAEGTVKVHRRHLFDILGTHTRIETLREANQRGLFENSPGPPDNSPEGAD